MCHFFFLSFWVWLVFVVVEARDKQRGIPQVVERWGDPESSKCVTAVSMIDRNSQPVCIDEMFYFSFFLF